MDILIQELFLPRLIRDQKLRILEQLVQQQHVRLRQPDQGVHIVILEQERQHARSLRIQDLKVILGQTTVSLQEVIIEVKDQLELVLRVILEGVEVDLHQEEQREGNILN